MLPSCPGKGRSDPARNPKRRRIGLRAIVVLAATCVLGLLGGAARADTAAPKTPEVVVKRSSPTSLLLTWTAVDRASGYDVFVGTVRVQRTTEPIAELRNLVCNTRYVLHVTAFDRVGRRSMPSITGAKTDGCSAESPGTPGSPNPPSPPGSPPSPPLQPPTAGSLLVAPNGSDRSSCALSAPCATFNRAYHQASPGQAVYVAAGSYPKQTIGLDAAKTAAAADVVFLPAA